MISLWLWHNQKLKICECWTKMAGCCGRKQTAHTWTDPRFALPPFPLYPAMAPALQTPETKETKRNEKKSTALPSSLMRFSICSCCHWSKFYAHLLRLEEKSSLPSVESLCIYIYIFLTLCCFCLTIFGFSCCLSSLCAYVSHVTVSLQVLSPLSSRMHCCCPLLDLPVIFSLVSDFPSLFSSSCTVWCQVLVPGLCRVAFVEINHTRNNSPPRNRHDLMHMPRLCAIIVQK